MFSAVQTVTPNVAVAQYGGGNCHGRARAHRARM